jgi:hypothetical protein
MHAPCSEQSHNEPEIHVNASLPQTIRWNPTATAQTSLDFKSLLKNWSIDTVKYSYNRIIFVATPSNSNNVTLVKVVASSSVAIPLCNDFLCCSNNHGYCHVMKHCD